LANAPWQYPEELIGNPFPYWFAPEAATMPASIETAIAVIPKTINLFMLSPTKFDSFLLYMPIGIILNSMATGTSPTRRI
jgi:hypothetical protein